MAKDERDWERRGLEWSGVIMFLYVISYNV